MVDIESVTKLLNSFPNSFINCETEVILIPKNNIFFSLKGCNDEDDLKVKTIEYVSRSASFAMPYRYERKNNEYHQNVAKSINQYLHTTFSVKDYETLYIRFGNGINHDECISFVKNGMNMESIK